MLTPGGNYATEFTLTDPDTGSGVDADVLPGAVAARNGVDDPGFVLTVGHISTGRYNVAGTIPATYNPGDNMNVVITVTISAVTYSQVIDTWNVQSPASAGTGGGTVVITGISSSASTSTLQAISDALTSPLRVRGDAGEVEQRPVADLIAAANYLASVDAAQSGRSGLRYTRLIPDGTVNRCRFPRPPWTGGRL